MRRTTRTRWLGLALCIGLTAAACGNDDTGGEDPDTTAGASGPAPGLTDDTIKIGAVASDLEALRALGLVDINNGDQDLVWNTLIDEVNDRGGVAGRQIELHFSLYNPVDPASADQACTELTVDNEVFAVLGGVGGPVRERITCFLETNETMVIGGSHTPDLVARAKAPWISDGMAAERRFNAILDLYDAQGYFDDKTVAVFDDSTEVAVTDGVIIPALARIGITDPLHVTSNVASNDETALAQQTAVFAQNLQDAGVDQLLIVQSQISLGFGLMRQEGYEGDVLTIGAGSALAGLGGLDERDPATFDGGIGPMGLTADESWEDPLAQECVEIFETANPNIDVIPSTEVESGEPDYFGTIVGACRLIRLFEKIMEGAGDDPTYDSVLAAAESTGTFALPSQPFNSGAPGKLDFDDGLRIGVFDSTIGTDGGLSPLTEMENIG